MRARWMWNIRQLLLSVWFEGVALPPSLSHITTESQWRSLILTAGGDYWHVYMSKKTDGGKNTVKYLGRYLKKPPIAGSRLAHYAGSATLSFRYHDHNTGELATETLTQRDIVARLKQHIPEKFFRKRTARTVLTGMCYSVGSVMRQGSSWLTRLTGQSAMTSRTWRR